MTDFSDAGLFKLFIAALGTAYTVVFGLIANKMWGIPAEIEEKLTEFKTEFHIDMTKKLDKIEGEAKLAHQRIDVHDRISSKLADDEFDSRAVVQGGRYPNIKNPIYER
jgi:hypothetical protein